MGPLFLGPAFTGPDSHQTPPNPGDRIARRWSSPRQNSVVFCFDGTRGRGKQAWGVNPLLVVTHISFHNNKRYSINLTGFFPHINGWLVVSTYPSETYEFASCDDDIPNRQTKCSKPPSSRTMGKSHNWAMMGKSHNWGRKSHNGLYPLVMTNKKLLKMAQSK